eukprot:2570087-Amphidinium_carterae.1
MKGPWKQDTQRAQHEVRIKRGVMCEFSCNLMRKVFQQCQHQQGGERDVLQTSMTRSPHRRR